MSSVIVTNRDDEDVDFEDTDVTDNDEQSSETDQTDVDEKKKTKRKTKGRGFQGSGAMDSRYAGRSGNFESVREEKARDGNQKCRCTVSRSCTFIL